MDKVDAMPLESVPALMEEVQGALRRGDFGALALLTLRMEQAEASLHLAGGEELLRIRRLAERNARTLIAARRGIKAARRRIAEVLSAARGLVTYDRQGHRVEESDVKHLARRF